MVFQDGIVKLLTESIPLGLQRFDLMIVVQLLVFVKSIQVVVFSFFYLKLIPNVLAFFVLTLDEVFKFDEFMLLL